MVLPFHGASLSIVNLPAVADRNDSDRPSILNKYNAPITNPKSAPASTLKPPYVARSVGRINRQFEIDAPANIGRKFAPLTGRRWRERDRFHSP